MSSNFCSLQVDRQMDLLNDLLEFACLLIVGDGDACAAIVQTVHEFDGRETPNWQAVQALHRTLVQNLLNFLIVSAHLALPSVSAIFDSLLDFLISLKGFIPINCEGVTLNLRCDPSDLCADRMSRLESHHRFFR